MRLFDRWKAKIRSLPKSVLIGVAGVALAYVASVGIYSMALPWSGGADSARHVDYVYRVYNLELAEPHSLAYDISLDDPKTADREDFIYNGAAPHPPLHHAIMAVFSGGLLESGDWQAAVAVMRVINVLIGLAGLLVLAWAGWKLGGRHRSYFAVAVPAFAGLITPFITVAADVYNDPLVVLLATSALAVTAVSLKTGPSWRQVLALAVICSLAMLTKVTFLSTLLLVLFFVAIGYALHHDSRLKAIKLAMAADLAIGLSVVVTSGWFYYRNYQLSGSWFRAYPKYEIGGREQQTLLDSLTNPHFWGVLPEGLLGIRPWEDILPINKSLSLVVFALATVGFIIVAAKLYRRWRKAPGRYSRRQLIVASLVALMVLQVVALYAQQLQHSIGWGLINPRYFLTALLPIGLYFAIASLVAGKLRPYIVSLAVAMYSLAAMPAVVYYVQSRQGQVVGDNVVAKLASLMADNGLAPQLLYIWLLAIVAGTIMTFIAIKNIHNQSFTTSKSDRRHS